ncbi:MAG TPA: CBS domain-containing protein [Casimicrobiaceae bacterium]|nr:CBS domain-containing protein [Casimicrobiaceae bacterium]
MGSEAIYSTTFASLKDTDTVADATARMLTDRVSDLPVVDASGALVGLFRLDRLYAALLPRGALLDGGLTDLAFVSDTLGQLREKMREIEHCPVREFTAMPEHVVHPETPPLQIVLLLHQGANNIPVVSPDGGKLVGMASARDVLAALGKRASA